MNEIKTEVLVLAIENTYKKVLKEYESAMKIEKKLRDVFNEIAIRLSDDITGPAEQGICSAFDKDVEEEAFGLLLDWYREAR